MGEEVGKSGRVRRMEAAVSYAELVRWVLGMFVVVLGVAVVVLQVLDRP